MRRSRKILAATMAAAVTVTLLTAASVDPAPSARKPPHRFSPATVRALTSIVLAGRAAAGIPGMSVGIWVPGQGTYVRVSGTADVATGRPMSLADHFRIASITKTFTAPACGCRWV